MSTARIAINGFGRIGRASAKIIIDKYAEKAELVAINDLTDSQTLSYLLKHDTAYGTYDKEVSYTDDSITIAGIKVTKISEPDPTKLPWKALNIDVVLECTGRFTKDSASKAHLSAGAKKVVISAPTKGEGDVPTFLMGVNDSQYLGQNLVSNASCTTNCISPVLHVIHKNIGVLKAGMTTIHAYTADQNLVDGPHKDLRRARAAAANMIPTSSGAAISTTEVIPDLKGKFDGCAIRVPVIVGSISDITMLVSKKTTKEEVNDLFKKAAQTPFLKDILSVSDEPLVSSDIVGTSYSAIVDLSMTQVIDGDFIKVFAWYDNEWGYSNRLVEMAIHTTS